MTRPVRPASASAEVRGARKSVESLAKRPAPVSSSFLTEWIQLTSTTDTGTSYTILDWAAQDGEYDSTGPTFTVNASSNLTIFKDGLYQISIVYRSTVDNINVNTVRIIEADFIGGETPKGMFTPWTTSREARILSRLNHVDTGAEDTAVQPWPAYMDWAYYRAGTFGPGTLGASELQIRAFKEENNVGVAETQWVFYMFVARLGGGR